MFFGQILIVLALVSYSVAKLRILADGMLEKCDSNANSPGAIEPNIEFIMDDNDVLFLNGTYFFHREIKKWPVKFYTMRLVEGNWIYAPFQRIVEDFCKVIHSPMEVWYFIFKKVGGCPIKKGVK